MEQSLDLSKIQAFLTKKQPLNHPIKEHPLEGKEEYVQTLYLDLLCVIAQYENSGADAAVNFVQRLMAGFGRTEPVTEHIKAAMEITVERFEEFLRQCKENKIEDIFLLDAMLLACAADAPNKKQLDFLAQTADALKLSKSRVTWLSEIARVLLAQDAEAYYALSEELPKDFRNEFLPSIVCYLKQFVVGVLVDTEELLWLYAPEKIPFDPEVYLREDGWFTITNRTVVMENMIMKSESSWKAFKFENNEHITLRSCVFRGYIFNFTASAEIDMENCEFEGSREYRTSYFILLNNAIGAFKINRCSFYNIYIYHDYYSYSLIRSAGDDVTPVSIQKSRFENICKDTDAYSVIGFGGKVSLSDCQFISCTGRTLFSSNVTEKNCEFRNCPALNR